MKNLFLLICVLVTTICSSQSKEIDSLKMLLKTEKNENKKNDLLVAIGYAYLTKTVYYDSSYIYLKKANDLANKYQNKKLYAESLFDLGNVFLLTDNYTDALKYYKETLLLFNDLKEFKNTAKVHNNIARIYFDKKKYYLAEEELKKGREIAKNSNNDYLYARITINLAEIKFKKGNYGGAKSEIFSVEKIFDSLNKQNSLKHRLLSQIYFLENDIKNAKIEAKNALKIAKIENDLDDLEHILDSYLLLAKISKTEMDYENATLYKGKVLLYKDSIAQIKRKNEVKKAQLNNTLDQKESELTILEQKNKYLTTIYILVVIGIILIMFLISRQIKISRMTKDIHDIQNRFINPQTNNPEDITNNS